MNKIANKRPCPDKRGARRFAILEEKRELQRARNQQPFTIRQ
ncbi:hypothetical protein [Paenibacillus algorifonticola]|nr:hypothetical protein [Paenibacillus algorifonticola]